MSLFYEQRLHAQVSPVIWVDRCRSPDRRHAGRAGGRPPPRGKPSSASVSRRHRVAAVLRFLSGPIRAWWRWPNTRPCGPTPRLRGPAGVPADPAAFVPPSLRRATRPSRGPAPARRRLGPAPADPRRTNPARRSARSISSMRNGCPPAAGRETAAAVRSQHAVAEPPAPNGFQRPPMARPTARAAPGSSKLRELAVGGGAAPAAPRAPAHRRDGGIPTGRPGRGRSGADVAAPAALRRAATMRCPGYWRTSPGMGSSGTPRGNGPACGRACPSASSSGGCAGHAATAPAMPQGPIAVSNWSEPRVFNCGHVKPRASGCQQNGTAPRVPAPALPTALGTSEL